jgi:ADP-dependent NAD(P)H-hydrate dehydratase / NAD(P)H-hydrate epimerase
VALATPIAPAPFPGCTALFDGAAVRGADAAASDSLGIPSVLLMERAGHEAAQAILDRYSHIGAAIVVVGKGNNGGDGMVVARHLDDAGWDVEVMAPRGGRPGTPDGVTMAGIARRVGIPVAPIDTGRLDGYAGVVVDALLGTGTRGAPKGAVKAAIAAIDTAAGPVVSLDVPSGVDTDSGRAPGLVVCADLTVTFHGDKLGLRVEPGRSCAGEVVVVDIGIPSVVRLEHAAWLVGADAAAAVPPKDPGGEKYGAGAVLVVAGSAGMVGAGCLASKATLRAGAGLTVAAVPASLRAEVASHLLEVMTAAVPDDRGAFGPAGVAAVLAEARRVGAVALGPGLGRALQTTGFVRDLLGKLALPLVVDADALWHLGEMPTWLRERSGTLILTPHAGEAARLLGARRADIERERLGSATRLAEATGAVVVLKGPSTIVATPDGEVAVNSTGGPQLSTAGTGDVLTGIITAFLAKGMRPFAAAAVGVAVHGAAAQAAGRGDGTVAGDLIDALPGVLARS